MRYVYYLIDIGDALALFSVILLLLRGPFRKFWALLVYVVWELVSLLILASFDLINNAATVGAGLPLNHLADSARRPRQHQRPG